MGGTEVWLVHCHLEHSYWVRVYSCLITMIDLGKDIMFHDKFVLITKSDIMPQAGEPGDCKWNSSSGCVGVTYGLKVQYGLQSMCK